MYIPYITLPRVYQQGFFFVCLFISIRNLHLNWNYLKRDYLLAHKTFSGKAGGRQSSMLNSGAQMMSSGCEFSISLPTFLEASMVSGRFPLMSAG